jgi:phospholipid/cholesterol/gamma-HCH transport system ATP-binding protein
MHSDSDALIEIDQLSFSYDNRPILKDINLTIPRHKLVAIMGGSGCGKTTLLKLIGRQLSPTTGSVRIDGIDIATLNQKELYALRRKMGMLYQFGALFGDLSVYENIAFPIREHFPLPENLIHKIVYMKLQAVGLRGTANFQPSELSGGMARRVALARAVALDPMLVMYDEPFAGLDPISLSTIGHLIRELNDALQLTSILVTHDIIESMAIVDYIYFISNGQIVAEGTPDEIRHSEDPLVQQFVRGERDGPLPFHYPAPPYHDALLG